MEPKTPKPLRKLNIFLNCFIVLFLLAYVYLDIIVKLESFFWTITKLIAFLIVLIIATILRRIRDKDDWGFVILSIIMGILCISLLSWQEMRKYKTGLCLDKFGTEFNQRRQKLGIPVLPADWHIDFRGDRSTDWTKKDSLGHYFKTTVVDSLCGLEYEEDRYNFKPARGVSRSMSVQIWFAKGKGSDTISYRYYDGDSTRNVTRRQADSIFSAEKIQNDY